MRLRFFTTLLFTGLLSLAIPADGAFFKYVDEDGQQHFVDDKSKIPKRYRQEIRVIKEERDLLSPARYNALRQKRSQKARQLELRALERQELRRQERQERQQQTSVIIKRNRIFIPVEVRLGRDKVNLSLLLDTGATRTVFHRNALEGLSLPKGEPVKARIAGGETITSRKIRFSQIKVGPHQVEDLYAMVLEPTGPLAFDGMLGMDFLKHHPYQIDYENALILWDD